MPPPHSCLFEVPDCHTSNSSEPVFICGPTDQSEVWRPVILVGSTTKSDQHHPTSQDKILGRILNESGHVTTPWSSHRSASGSAFIGSAVACWESSSDNGYHDYHDIICSWITIGYPQWGTSNKFMVWHLWNILGCWNITPKLRV